LPKKNGEDSPPWGSAPFFGLFLWSTGGGNRRFSEKATRYG